VARGSGSAGGEGEGRRRLAVVVGVLKCLPCCRVFRERRQKREKQHHSVVLEAAVGAADDKLKRLPAALSHIT
jgi:hypothetical protein